MWTGLRKAKALNPTVELVGKQKAVDVGVKGKPANITASFSGSQYYWGLTGCVHGKQHMRYCQAKALHSDACLECPFCAYCPIKWTAAGLELIPGTEERLMSQLGWARQDTKFCRGVQISKIWPAPVDFMSIDRHVFLQADGSCHFEGIHDTSPGCKLQKDMQCCVQFIRAGKSMIRVHHRQLQYVGYPFYLAAAIAEAEKHTCIVLSAAYAALQWYDNGRMVSYAQALADMLPGFRVLPGQHGNIVIKKE